MTYFDTPLNIEEVKRLIEQHKKTISKMENSRGWIICSIIMLLLITYLVSFFGNLILTIFAIFICGIFIFCLISLYPPQTNTDRLENEIKQLTDYLNELLDEQLKLDEMLSRTLYDVTLTIKGLRYNKDSFDKLCQELIREFDDLPYLGYSTKELTEELIFGGRFYKYPTFDIREVEFIPEVDNEYDPNALKIVVRGHHLGYVAKSKNRKVLRLTTDPNNEVINIAEIYGGEYKEFDPNENRLRKVSDSFRIRIKLKVLKK